MAVPSPLMLPGMTPSPQGNIQITDETLALVAQSIQQRQTLNRSIDTSYGGFQGYDLTGPAETVTPTETMFGSSVSRVKERGFTMHHFNAITKLGWNGIMGAVSDGGVASEITPTTLSLYVIVQSIAAQQSITFQEEWRTMGYMGDLKATMMTLLLYSLKLIEEQWLISGCDYLWAPPAPLTPTGSTTGGTVLAGTYYIAVSAVSANGETFATPAGAYNAAGTFASVAVTTTGTTSSIAVTFFRVPYASSYNVYVGTSTATMYKQVAANMLSGALPTQGGLSLIGNGSFTLSSLTTSGTTQPTANTAITVKDSGSNLPTMFNGLMALIFSAGNQTYGGPSNVAGNQPTSAYSAIGQSVNVVAMTGLAPMGPTILQPASTAGSLAYSDLQSLFLAMYYNALAKPTRLAVSAYDAITVTNLLQNNANTRFMVDLSKPETQANMVYGIRVGKMLNPATNTVLDVEVWPYLPQGTIIALSDVLPWPVPNFNGKTMEVRVNQDYRGFDFPPTAQYQKWAFADYVDECLKLNFLGGFGAITGILPTVV